ncbi:GNAT family N-acetyltransferase [Nonomuraea zeae]|uniref:GNAT family N-acetyltransferase n=1 Tax=Nonomuraea zeae TaxID=1642303 RepID=A0A5S4FK70_9ACTN|nr:GNAT family N-acetyltransferase [Nonomuraea zeae]
MDVGLPGHVARHIVPDPTPATIERLTGALTTPGTWLKLCAPAAVVTPLLPERWSVQDPEFMMTTSLSVGPAARRTSYAHWNPAPPAGYTPAVTTRAGVTVARLLTAAGEVAARGQFAMAGRTAVVDQVQTASGHRRRGLGTVIMRMLATTAAAAGAHTGVLVATAEGQALYETLGWKLRTPVTAAVLKH